MIPFFNRSNRLCQQGNTSYQHWLKMSGFALLMALVTPITHASDTKELKGVKSEISRQKQVLSKQQKSFDQLQKSLKNEELSIARIEKMIRQTQHQLTTSRHNDKQLGQKVAQLEADQTQYTNQLKTLLQMYYVTSRDMLNQDMLQSDPKSERVRKYFQQLAKARVKAIEQLKQTQQDLKSNQQQQILEQEKIQMLLKTQTEKRDALTKKQVERKQILRKITQEIRHDKHYLAELQRNEMRLKAEIAKAAKRNRVLMDGLARHRGKLPWPLQGRVLHRYGTSQGGHATWKGMVIKAKYGQAVKAVYSGTVVFSEYLRGYGLVVLIDHGKGDMTLYGYNQSLVKKEGDKVLAGETIATAGDTGGQSTASLYFEIRRNSKAQNPQRWLK